MFGIFLWEAHARREPYDDCNMSRKEMLEKIKSGELRPSKLDESVCSAEMWKLIDVCWSQNVNDRPTMDKIHADLKWLLSYSSTGYKFT